MPPKTSSLEIQLELLNERIRMYAAQRWQIPVAYVSIVGITLSNFKDAPKPSVPLGIIYVSLGIFILVLMNGYKERLEKLVNDTVEVENMLSLPVSSVIQVTRTKEWPYKAICIAGVLLSLAFFAKS